MDYTITICFLSAQESYALADEVGCAQTQFGPGIYLVWSDDTLPRGPFLSVPEAAQSLV